MVPNRYHFCPSCGTKYSPDQLNQRIKTCQQCDFVLYSNQSVAVGAIIREKDQILLTKRKHDPYINTWDVPGGFVEIFEHPEQAIIRELQEELGVNSKIIQLFGIYAPTEYSYRGHTKYNCDLFYEMELLSHDIHPADDITDFAWFTAKTLPLDEIGFPSVQKAMKKIQEAYA